MERLPWILGFGVLGSARGVGAAASVLLVPARLRTRLLPALVSYATGTLLGAAFLGMLPEAMQGASPRAVLAIALAGVVTFFALEKLVLWRHCHDADCEEHQRAVPLILFGDAMHNFVDGVVIGAAFLASVPLGVATSLAALTHEIPQEVGDFAILLEAGYGRWKAFGWNLLSSTTTLVGGLLAWGALHQAQHLVPFFLALTAGGFIYVAAADLIPGLHKHVAPKVSAVQVLLVLVGIGTIAALRHAH
ncbi:MAG: ZIP family metal transporter [Myxococcota bacterium]